MILELCPADARSKRKHLNSEVKRKRKYIIKCCGKNSCINPKTNQSILKMKRTSLSIYTVHITMDSSSEKVASQTELLPTEMTEDILQPNLSPKDDTVLSAPVNPNIPPGSELENVSQPNLIPENQTILSSDGPGEPPQLKNEVTGGLPNFYSQTTTTKARSDTSAQVFVQTNTPVQDNVVTKLPSTSQMIGVGTKPATSSTKAPQVFPSCTSPPCIKDNSLFNNDGSLRDASSYGFWVEMCGKQYLFGRNLLNWEQNVEKCCKIGMKPIDLNLPTDKICFDAMIVNGDYRSRLSRFYWTFGLRRSNVADLNFQWCSSGNNITSDAPNNFTGDGLCVLMDVSKIDNFVKLINKDCAALGIFSCQGRKIPQPCESPVCPAVACKKQDSLYEELPDNVSKYLANPSKHGIWIQNDTRVLMISYPNDSRTFVDSFAACCSVGLRLLSMHHQVMYSLLVDAFKNASITSGKFWTSATDEGCKKTFGFCSSKNLLREDARWAAGQPDLSIAEGSCLAVSPDALLHNELCTSKLRYVCQGRAPTGSLVNSVERECAQEYMLSTSEVKKLMNSTPDELREKCFLKCFGEGTGLFIDGKLAGDKIFAQFQNIALNDFEKLLDMSSTLDFCSNATKGMNPCDKASNILKCGQENSPDAFGELLNAVELSITESPIVLPLEKAICPEYECLIRTEERDLVAYKQNSSTVNVPFVFYGQLTFACNKKFLAFKSSTLVNSIIL
ncbi:Hypothetical predicted protein [Cloeon dipterum]|uniref:C-type lectin domain-containing protein n=1 Tax=Cloeon dipterum TaxID=197152 RepID=A0A8S1BX82_9INSE|nr:Hypothetical predicted protein [Cloeon dipterum]